MVFLAMAVLLSGYESSKGMSLYEVSFSLETALTVTWSQATIRRSRNVKDWILLGIECLVDAILLCVD